jgi:hypothetical protein
VEGVPGLNVSVLGFFFLPAPVLAPPAVCPVGFLVPRGLPPDIVIYFNTSKAVAQRSREGKRQKDNETALRKFFRSVGKSYFSRACLRKLPEPFLDGPRTILGKK